jgi:hypothetical protein
MQAYVICTGVEIGETQDHSLFGINKKTLGNLIELNDSKQLSQW